MTDTKTSVYRRKRFWAGILLAQFVLFYILSHVQIFAESFEEFFEFQKGFHQQLTAGIPFSVGDVIYILAGLAAIYFLLNIFRKRTKRTAFLQILIFANLLYFVYQIFWGMLYFQKPILENLPEEEITVEETKALSLKYLELCKQSRNQVSEDESGVFKYQDLAQIKTEIIQSQNQLPHLITTTKATGINNFKTSLFSGMMNYSGILGYYNPFTAEAQYNADLPHSYIPFTLAHESAHQLGFAREQEANFIGFLIGVKSVNADLKYSTQYAVLKSLLNALAEKNEPFVKSILAQYSAGMKRDRLAEKKFVADHQGFFEELFGLTNDLFLKSNRQEGSITYSYFVDLLVRYERLETR